MNTLNNKREGEKIFRLIVSSSFIYFNIMSDHQQQQQKSQENMKLSKDRIRDDKKQATGRERNKT